MLSDFVDIHCTTKSHNRGMLLATISA